MKQIGDLAKGAVDRIKANRSDFPSYEHEVAWTLCQYFDEPFGFWVRNVMYAGLNAGQVLHEFNELKSKPFTRRQKAKMLMSTMKIVVHRRKEKDVA